MKAAEPTTPRGGRRRMAFAGVGAVLALVLAGCSDAEPGSGAGDPELPEFDSSESAESPKPEGVEAPRPPAETPPEQEPAPSPEPAPDGVRSGLCTTGDLTLGLGRGSGAAGTVYRPLRFTNVGDDSCVIQGFPGVSYVAGDDGHQVGPAAYREGTKGDPVTLEPGGTAHADVGFVQVRNYDPADCKPTKVRGLRVYPPQEYDSMYLKAPGTGCASSPPGHQLTVKTIQPGKGGA